MSCLWKWMLFLASIIAGWEQTEARHHPRRHLTAWVLNQEGAGEFKRAARLRRDAGDGQDDKPHITSMKIISKVNSRFAQVVTKSEMTNPSTDKSRLASFLVYLPETAFISNFTMIINGHLQVAVVKSKEEAEKDFEEARKQNKTAGKVAAAQPTEPVRDMEAFEVSVNVRPQSSVQFELTYQQLLIRRLKLYEQRISLRPNQVVDELSVQAHVYEPQGLTELVVVEPSATVGQAEGNLDAQIDQNNQDGTATVSYNPSKDRQEEMNPEKGIHGDLVIKYDVKHSYDIGLVQIEDDYIVQYISPESNDLQPLAKNIIFVIDISGSMSGDKMWQTTEAVLIILGELRSFDNFMLILFDDALTFWPREKVLVPANADNVVKAKNFAKEFLEADGSTNINEALAEAAKRLKKSEQYGSNLIVFLTDGNPTVGVTRPSDIITNVVGATEGEVSIFSLGFGDEYTLDFDLLKALSYRTGGFARRVIPGTDTAFQLTDFFLELNTPLLYDVQVIYPDNVMDPQAVTKTSFPQYFSGSELVVVGKLLEEAPSSWDAKVTAVGHNDIELVQNVNSGGLVIPEAAAVAYQPGFVYSLFVYWKIKNLLDEELMTDDEDEKLEIRNYALNLALENQLVTPLTSMIIVQADKADKSNKVYDLADAGRGPVLTRDLTVYHGMSASSTPELKVAYSVFCMSLIVLLA